MGNVTKFSCIFQISCVFLFFSCKPSDNKSLDIPKNMTKSRTKLGLSVDSEKECKKKFLKGKEESLKNGLEKDSPQYNDAMKLYMQNQQCEASDFYKSFIASINAGIPFNPDSVSTESSSAISDAAVTTESTTSTETSSSFLGSSSNPNSENYAQLTGFDAAGNYLDPTLTYYFDIDNDGFGSNNPQNIYTDLPFEDYSTNNQDCDDYDEDINPDAKEDCQDQIDNDCDGEIDEQKYFTDADKDGYGTNSETTATVWNTCLYSVVQNVDLLITNSVSVNNKDCDDSDNTLHENAELYIDRDVDGYGVRDGTAITQCLSDSDTAILIGSTQYVTNTLDCFDDPNDHNTASTINTDPGCNAKDCESGGGNWDYTNRSCECSEDYTWNPNDILCDYTPLYFKFSDPVMIQVKQDWLTETESEWSSLYIVKRADPMFLGWVHYPVKFQWKKNWSWGCEKKSKLGDNGDALCESDENDIAEGTISDQVDQYYGYFTIAMQDPDSRDPNANIPLSTSSPSDETAVTIMTPQEYWNNFAVSETKPKTTYKYVYMLRRTTEFDTTMTTGALAAAAATWFALGAGGIAVATIYHAAYPFGRLVANHGLSFTDNKSSNNYAGNFNGTKWYFESVEDTDSEFLEVSDEDSHYSKPFYMYTQDATELEANNKNKSETKYLTTGLAEKGFLRHLKTDHKLYSMNKLKVRLSRCTETCQALLVQDK